MPAPFVIIPCFNEATRLQRDHIQALLQVHPNLHVLMVDDGSSDRTFEVAQSYCELDPARAQAMRLQHNSGKAEAVRQGMLRALEQQASMVGFADADFSTPPSEIGRLLGVLETHEQIDVVLGSRIARLGADIDRSAVRHYMGRVFATAASNALRLPVYDTQCGAKWFRLTPVLVEALQQPFTTTWAFDVELLGRLLGSFGARGGMHASRILEVPLDAWHEVGGSKLRPMGMIKGFMQVMRLLAASRGLIKLAPES